MTRSTIARIVRLGLASGTLRAGESPVMQAAYVRGWLRGRRALRRARAAS